MQGAATMALLALGVGMFWACGGKAVIDGPTSGSGGAGGSGSNSSTSSVSPLCQTPEPVGELLGCSSAQSAGSGTFTCTTALCDDNGNLWQSECSGDTCTCLFNLEVECTCFIDNGTFCEGIPSCCPEPFPD